MPYRRILHARYVFPVLGEPIENGFVSVENGQIAEVGKTPPNGEWLDLGNVAILPGLINAHTHLEFSGLSEPLGTPGMGFVEWIRKVIEWRGCHPLDSAQAIANGLRECSQEGVTSIGHISQLDDRETASDSSVIDGTSFIELIAPTRDRMPVAIEFLQEGFADRQAMASALSWRFGLSPHAPYSVHPELLQSVVAFSAARKAPLAMHLAESREEMQLLRNGAGPFRDFLEERDLFDPTIFPGGKRPLEYLKLLAAASRALIVHGNYLDGAEIAFLSQHAEKMAVVYCPRTHAFFRHDPYPLEKMLAAGVTVALGTDSRASSPDLRMLAEMRFTARQYPQLGRERILELGTLGGARALGRAEEIGSLEAGKTANFAIVKLPEDDSNDPYRLLFESEEPIVQTWFRGRPDPLNL